VLCFDGDAAGQRAAMRAVVRALPLLAPMRSLSIVQLPAGLDPDDLVNRKGAGAMERLLAAPTALIDFLWNYEREAQPLSSPEAKAGLKARLMAHVDTIADREIQSLYRRELSDRFSAFAYPPRQRPQRGPWTGVEPPARGLSSGARTALQRSVSGGQRASLLEAVVAGFQRHPSEIARHTEALIHLARLDPKAAPAIESVIALAETLDSHGADAISPTQGFPAPPEDQRFAFLREGTSPGVAREELAEAVSLLARKPALEAALAATVARFDEDPEGSFAEQARLRAQLTTVEERLKAFGRRKAGTPADQV
jgi:DNA primase